jgi:hypothetical protein
MELQLMALIVIVVVCFILSEWFHYKERQDFYKERRDLYNRLMAKNMGEYISANTADKKPEKQPKKKTVDPLKAAMQEDARRGYLE